MSKEFELFINENDANNIYDLVDHLRDQYQAVCTAIVELAAGERVAVDPIV